MDPYLMAQAMQWLWCALFHHKHHVWELPFRRDCSKCGLWVFYPKLYDKEMAKLLGRYSRAIRTR